MDLMVRILSLNLGRAAGTRAAVAVCAFLTAVLAAVPARSGGTPDSTYLWDESSIDTVDDAGLSLYVAANNFAIDGDAVRLKRVDAWIGELVNSKPGVLEGFSGSISWAIYADSGGVPGALIASGTDDAPEVSFAGFQFSSDSDDVFHFVIQLQPQVGLAATGTYWLALHEGPWLSPDDGTGIGWIYSGLTMGGGISFSSNVTNPGSWYHIGITEDSSFALLGDFVYWGQSDYDLDTAHEVDISTHVAAKKFALNHLTQVFDAELWIADDLVSDNGRIDSFGGAISWALYDDDAGSPGSLLASGTDDAPRVKDTGSQDTAGADVARVRIHLGPGVTIPTGFHWLALHEGTWEAPSDGSPIWLLGSHTTSYAPMKIAGSISQTSWSSAVADGAIVLYNDQIWSSGFESGSSCSWAVRTGGLTCP